MKFYILILCFFFATLMAAQNQSGNTSINQSKNAGLENVKSGGKSPSTNKKSKKKIKKPASRKKSATKNKRNKLIVDDNLPPRSSNEQAKKSRNEKTKLIVDDNLPPRSVDIDVNEGRIQLNIGLVGAATIIKIRNAQGKLIFNVKKVTNANGKIKLNRLIKAPAGKYTIIIKVRGKVYKKEIRR